jgi:hypothetical protein
VGFGEGGEGRERWGRGPVAALDLDQVVERVGVLGGQERSQEDDLSGARGLVHLAGAQALAAGRAVEGVEQRSRFVAGPLEVELDSLGDGSVAELASAGRGFLCGADAGAGVAVAVPEQNEGSGAQGASAL